MTLGRMIAIAGGGDEDEQTLRLAAALASRHDAMVEILPVYPGAAVDLITLGLTLSAFPSRAAVDETEAAHQAIGRRVEAAARRAAGEQDVVFGPGPDAPRLALAPREADPLRAVSKAATLCDLAILGQAYLEGPGGDGALLARLLFDDRTPVLVGRGPALSLDTAVIAWDGGAQAGRAIRAAVPILRRAARILVLQREAGLDPWMADPGLERLNAYLGAHGVGAGRAIPASEAGEQGEALLQGARDAGADLLVAGAFGHARLRETIFGGATRTFLKASDGPSLLLAH